MKLSIPNFEQITQWIALGFFVAVGVGLFHWLARSIDFLNKLAW